MAFDDGQSAPVKLSVAGEARSFDIHNPDLPKWIKREALTAGGYPYDTKYDKKLYAEDLYKLHVELVKLQNWQEKSGARIICIFEGRDAAGKGGSIKALRENISPRRARVVALPKPTDRERSEWYFQRYAKHLPAAGEIVLFDRSWYNRAGVEPVMGFCTPEQHTDFLREAPAFETALTRDGIYLFKFWLNVGQETQLKRFHDRRHDPRRTWKLSPMDIEALTRWDAYSDARDQMLAATHTNKAPWTVVRMNDKRRGRINLLRHLLTAIPYDQKSSRAIGSIDRKIILPGTADLSHDR